jgi:hypothetical protein
MFKLLALLVTFLLVALALLALRQHRLELTSQSAAIYDTIRDRHHTLLDQRVEIARRTNPWALAAALNQSGVNTGDALRVRDTTLGAPANSANVPAVETDLVAPLLNDGTGHANPGRPR